MYINKTSYSGESSPESCAGIWQTGSRKRGLYGVQRNSLKESMKKYDFPHNVKVKIALTQAEVFELRTWPKCAGAVLNSILLRCH